MMEEISVGQAILIFIGAILAAGFLFGAFLGLLGHLLRLVFILPGLLITGLLQLLRFALVGLVDFIRDRRVSYAASDSDNIAASRSTEEEASGHEGSQQADDGGPSDAKDVAIIDRYGL